MGWIDDLEAQAAQRKAEGRDPRIKSTFAVTDRDGNVIARGDTWAEVEWAIDGPTSPWQPKSQPLALHPAFNRTP